MARPITTSVHFTNDYGKKISATISRDKYGELSVKNLTINDRGFNTKYIRTEWRERVIIEYCQQFVDLEELFADELYERETHHNVDNY